MRHPARLLPLATLLAACSGGGDAGPPEILGGGPGTRLAARTLVNPDGERIFTGFRDLRRGEDCAFGTASDGVTRCLPTLTVNRYTEGVLYADASCAETGRLILPRLGTGATLAVVAAQDSCPVRWRVHQVGAIVQAPAEVYYRSYPGAPCARVGSFVPSVAALGPEVPPAEFAAATDRFGPAAGGVRWRELVAEDGAWQSAGWEETASGTPCGFQPDEAGTYRCLPAATDTGWSPWADGACTVPAASQWASLSGCTPGVTGAHVAVGCRRRLVLSAVGPRVDAPRFSASTGACQGPSNLLSEVQAFYEVGAPLAPASFPAAAAVEVGTGRLRRLAVDPGSGPRGYGTYLDTSLGVLCTPASWAADGELRCTPVTEAMANVERDRFADAACSTRVAWAEGCDHPVGISTDMALTGDPNGRTHFFATGALHTGPTFVRVGADCLEDLAPPPGTPYLVTGLIPDQALAPFREELVQAR